MKNRQKITNKSKNIARIFIRQIGNMAEISVRYQLSLYFVFVVAFKGS